MTDLIRLLAGRRTESVCEHSWTRCLATESTAPQTLLDMARRASVRDLHTRIDGMASVCQCTCQFRHSQLSCDHGGSCSVGRGLGRPRCHARQPIRALGTQAVIDAKGARMRTALSVLFALM